MEIEELTSIGTRVLEITRSLGYQEGAFSFNLTFDKTIFAMNNADMEFVKKFTHPDFQAKNFTPQ